MATTIESKTILTATPGLTEKGSSIPTNPFKVAFARQPTGNIKDVALVSARESRTVLHIYFEHEHGHKVITPTLSPSQERRWGPKPKEQKTRRIARKAARKLREASQNPPNSVTLGGPTALPSSQDPAEIDEGSYFLHSPYLSFHLPPSVLYIGSDRYAPSRPAALVHTGCFWRSYKIQLGPSLSLPGVIDPRGVVSWRHNGGSGAALQDDGRNGDGRLLKGYKVRGWRLWGETGKSYVHGIRDKRKAGEVFDDPDVDGKSDKNLEETVRADEAVYLTWTRPLSRHTRLYTFFFRGIEFQWKGTGTVSEGRKCGWMLRFCHLKLVARIPVVLKDEKEDGMREICLAKYTSSIAAEKSGTLEVFDCAVVKFVEEWLPSLLEKHIPDAGKNERIGSELEEYKITKLKKTILYQLIVATALCMASAEKEKRHTLIDLIIGVLENAGNGGG